MEIHHPHHPTHKKNWKEYITEFLMLFFAVTLGFFVENYREHYIEQQREKEFLQLIVQDVDKFSGHIACDVDSRSEIVIPLMKNNELIGVLDIDSPMLACFDEADRQGLERLVSILLECSDC